MLYYCNGSLPGIARIIFQMDWRALLKSKQWRTELLYRYKRSKASKITVLNIQKLCLVMSMKLFGVCVSTSLAWLTYLVHAVTVSSVWREDGTKKPLSAKYLFKASKGNGPKMLLEIWVLKKMQKHVRNLRENQFQQRRRH